MPALEPNTIFAEKYRIEALMGSGGFSHVYRATQIDVERTVALKIFSPMESNRTANSDSTQMRNLLERFEQEAKLISKLKSPSTITMYDFGTAGSQQMYMALEFVDGLDLSDVTRVHGAIHAERVARILDQTLESLHEAHYYGIIHRDIKPQNIMVFEHLGKRDQVRLLDFGISRFQDSAHAEYKNLTADDALVGTPRYMAPEYIRGQAATPAADIYSLGLVMYELLVGEKAITAKEQIKIFAKQLSKKSIKLPDDVPDLDAPLRAIIDRMIEKDLGVRYATIAEIQEELSMRPRGRAPSVAVPVLEVSAFEPEPELEAGAPPASFTQASEPPPGAERTPKPSTVSGVIMKRRKRGATQSGSFSRPLSSTGSHSRVDRPASGIIRRPKTNPKQPAPASTSPEPSPKPAPGRSQPEQRPRAPRSSDHTTGQHSALLLEERPDQLEGQAAQRVGSVMGAWKLEKVIGVGGAAAVFRARRGDQVAALKTLHPEKQQHRVSRARFAREGKILSMLDHPNIIKVFDAGESSDGELYYVMEILEGMGLDELIKKRGALAESSISTIARQVLSALADAHDAGVVHRDIKPENVFITKSREIKLLDFGVASIARTNEKLTQDGAILGTPAFMAPEQARGRLDLISPASDTFSVGALLYHALADEYVHPAATAEEIMIHAATKRARSIARKRSELDPRLIAVIDRSLKFNPRERFQNAREMLDALEGRLALDASSEDDLSLADAAPSLTHRPKAPTAKEKTRAQSQIARERHRAMDDELEEDDEIISLVTKKLGQIFVGIERTIAMVRRYSWDHPEVQNQSARMFELLITFVADYPHYAGVDIKPYSFTFRGEEIWVPNSPFDAIPYNLFSAGLRGFEFRVGLDEEEFLGLLECFAINPQRDLAPEDDIATVMWERGFKNIEMLLVANIKIDAAGDQEGYLDECGKEVEVVLERLDKIDELEQHRALILTDLGDDAVAEANSLLFQQENQDSAQPWMMSGLLSQAELAQLSSAIERPSSTQAKLPYVLASTLDEANSAEEKAHLFGHIETMFIRMIRKKETFDVLQLHARLKAQLPDRDAQLAFTQRNFNATNYTLLLEHTGDAITHKRFTDELPPKRVAKYLHDFLAALPSEAGQAVSELYIRVMLDKVFVTVCYAFLQTHATGNEEVIGKMLPHVTLQHARVLAKILQDLDTKDSRYALRWANDQRDEQYQIDILSWRAARAPDEVAPEVIALASAPNPNVRVRALQAAQDHKIPGLYEFITTRIESDDFFKCPYSERRASLELVFRENLGKALSLCTNIVNSHGLTPNPTLDTTRMLAIELLVPHLTNPSAYDAVRNATRRRPWNSKELQKVATRAIQQFDESVS